MFRKFFSNLLFKLTQPKPLKVTAATHSAYMEKISKNRGDGNATILLRIYDRQTSRVLHEAEFIAASFDKATQLADREAYQLMKQYEV